MKRIIKLCYSKSRNSADPDEPANETIEPLMLDILTEIDKSEKF